MTGAIFISDDLVYNDIFKEQFCGERDFAVALEFNQRLSDGGETVWRLEYGLNMGTSR